MIVKRPSAERGGGDHGWLVTRHTFSFADYHDPDHMGFRSLRVINEDRVAPGGGFPMHDHRDMEIVTWVLEGALRHSDSMGNGSVIRPGEIQRMSAGRGVSHSEENASRGEKVHLLQIWIRPESRGGEPGYEQKTIPAELRRGKLALIASPDGREGSVRIRQDAQIYDGVFERGQETVLPLGPGRCAWVQVARGSGTVNGEDLSQGDGLALVDEPAVRIAAGSEEPTEFVVFDLA